MGEVQTRAPGDTCRLRSWSELDLLFLRTPCGLSSAPSTIPHPVSALIPLSCRSESLGPHLPLLRLSAEALPQRPSQDPAGPVPATHTQLGEPLPPPLSHSGRAQELRSYLIPCWSQPPGSEVQPLLILPGPPRPPAPAWSRRWWNDRALDSGLLGIVRPQTSGAGPGWKVVAGSPGTGCPPPSASTEFSGSEGDHASAQEQNRPSSLWCPELHSA